MQKFISLVLCSLFAFSLPAQDKLMIGQWRAHLPYQFGRYVTQSQEKVFYTTDLSVVALDKSDFSVEFYSTVNKLSETGTKLVKYDQNSGSLIVTYDNSIFDVIHDNTTFTFDNIREDGNFFNREINDITLAKGSKAYFSTAFGVVEFDVATQEFGFTANLDIEVFGLAYYRGGYYIATEEGIYTAVDDPNINLADIANWRLLDINDGFPADYSSHVIAVWQDELYFEINRSWLYKYNLQGLDSIYFDPYYFIEFLTAEGDHLLIGQYCKTGCDGKVIFYDGNGFNQSDGNACTENPRYAIETPEGQVWYADGEREIRVSEKAGGDCQKFKFDSPYDQLATELIVADDKLYVATEPKRVQIAFNDSGFYRYADGQWDVFNKKFVPVLEETNMIAFHRLAVNPSNGKVYAGTFFKGLVEFDGADQFVVFNENNSSLEYSIFDNNVIRIGGLAFDSKNNLWVANHTAQHPLSVLKADGSWSSDFPKAGGSGLPVRQMVVDKNDYKWIMLDEQGILVYDSGDLDDVTDDRSRIIRVNNSELPTNNVNCLAVDLDGDVWVGTDQGAVVFECGSNVFDDNCQGSKRIVEVGGFNAFLLEDEIINTIAIDGANRKWFGTESGVFVQSANGEEQIAFFNEENSPLFDNVIFDIAINPNSGVVYIGTAKGIIAYGSDAVEGSSVNSSDIYAYPNPVRPEYDGPIAIKGLARDADIKITDISGRLVYETKALGGQAIWDGRDYNGRKANSGVYLVYSTSTRLPENPDAAVAKILFLN